MKAPLLRPVGLWLAAGASLLLAGVLLLEASFGRVEAPEGPWPPAKVAEAKLLPLPAAVRPAESDTEGRPLFVPSRRPPPPAPVAPPVRIVRDQFQLQGTIVVGGLDIAMLREKQSGRVIRVEKGATISEMTLAEVYPDRVVLRAGEETETLVLTVATGPAPAGAAPAPGNAPAPRVAPPAPQGAAAPTPAPTPGQSAAASEEARREARRRLTTW